VVDNGRILVAGANANPSGQGDRGYITWKPNKRTKVEVEQLLTRLNFYLSRGLPAPTARDLFYDMHGIYGYPKTDAVRNKIYRLLRKMRRSKMIGFDAITDDSETAQSTKNYESPEDFFGQEERRAEAYALNLQANQPCVLEVFTEGAGKVAQLYQLTRNYHIPTRSPGGYDAIAPKRNLALRAAWEWERTGKRTHVLHCGDFDPDGEEIFRVLVEDAYAFFEAHVPTGTDLAEVLTFDRILTHYEQVIELSEERRATFDPYTVKAKDHRGQRWPHNFTAQLESVGLEVIVPTVRREIEELRDLWSTSHRPPKERAAAQGHS